MITELGNNKIVLRETISDVNQSVGLLEYQEHTDDKRVVTGPIALLPHLDPITAGIQLVGYLRNKYPRSDGWSLETVPKHCRPEINALIAAAQEQEGFDDYDFIGEVVDAVPKEEWEGQWELIDFLNLPQNQWPSNLQVRNALLQCDSELAAD